MAHAKSYDVLPTIQNQSFQKDLAERLLEKLGREEAIQSAREFHWHGVLAALDADQ